MSCFETKSQTRPAEKQLCWQTLIKLLLLILFYVIPIFLLRRLEKSDRPRRNHSLIWKESTKLLTVISNSQVSNMANFLLPRKGMKFWEQELCMSSIKRSYFTPLFCKFELVCESMKGTDIEESLCNWSFPCLSEHCGSPLLLQARSISQTKTCCSKAYLQWRHN